MAQATWTPTPDVGEVTVDEAARLYGRSIDTIYRIVRNELPADSVRRPRGGRMLIKSAAFEAVGLVPVEVAS